MHEVSSHTEPKYEVQFGGDDGPWILCLCRVEDHRAAAFRQAHERPCNSPTKARMWFTGKWLSKVVMHCGCGASEDVTHEGCDCGRGW